MSHHDAPHVDRHISRVGTPISHLCILSYSVVCNSFHVGLYLKRFLWLLESLLNFMSFEIILFFVLAVIAIGSAIMMVTRTNPVSSALFLILNFISLAGLYLTLNAQFLAVIQIAVYAGAIMVLVVFVIMLLNLRELTRLKEGLMVKHYIAITLGILLLVLLIPVLSSAFGERLQARSSSALEIGTVESIGKALLTTFILPFELTSVLLLSAIVGAVVLAKKRFP